MKILQIFGAVIAIHVLAFIFIFASPGCQTGPRSIPTPDATIPSGSPGSGAAYTPADLNAQTPPSATRYSNPTSGGPRADPIRPGSPNAAAVAPQKAAPNVAPVSTYSVQRGDSLWSIAKKNNLTVAELAKANNVSTGVTLQPGQKLIIPGQAPTEGEPRDLSTASAQKSAAPAPSAAPPRPAGETIRHVVQPGETLGAIARRYGVTVGQLVVANNISDPAKVRAGHELTIPGGTGTGKATARKESAPKTQQPAAQPQQPPPPQEPADEPTVRTKTAPKFEIAPPPPGQDLDSGLKDLPANVPTIKVDEPKENPPPKG
jgi:LysM repeat protein